MNILEIKDISLIYHENSSETLALKNISFDVLEGEFISIVGPSGCGKSSLLSIIANLLKPSSGDVYIKGQNLNKNNTSVGYMLQKDFLLPWCTIYQNVLLGLSVQKKMTTENIEFVEELLIKYGLDKFKNFKPSQLSGGLRQRAALIRTLALKPEILLLDEPFSSLDYQTRLFVCDEISTIIKNEKKTLIMVTHDIAEAISISDRVVVFSNRPATVTNIHKIELSVDNRSPMKSREAKEFKEYFNIIWKELGVHG